jgi:hypothetical protein
LEALTPDITTITGVKRKLLGGYPPPSGEAMRIISPKELSLSTDKEALRKLNAVPVATKDLNLSTDKEALRKLNAECPIAVHYELSAGGWYGFRNASGRRYGGRFSAREARFILERFRGWRGPISPSEFGAVAARAIQACGGVK